ncbi:glycosyl hydrolase catalytic core-domain-containing protein [Mycena leptocephala]|nr:glycosyl hydrolase catalytic core-domain-containing protein [Mycena leptocephala]
MRVLHLVPSLILSCACSVSAAKNSKRGLAYAEADRPTDIAVANQPASVLSWVYDWGRRYIPMQWGAGGIETFASTVLAQGAKTILAFNEPDFASQSNPLHSKAIKLGAPAVTNAPSGAPWLSAFLAACTNCTIEFISIHWPITEFACTSIDDAVVLNFLKQSETYLDSLDWIQGYSWFAFFQKETGSNYNLLDVNGQLTALGQAYVNNVV